MKISAIAPWFGAKRILAPRIVEALGPHRCYWEPFCGSMAVLLAKPRCSQETVNDLHGDLVNLARVIRSSKYGPLLYRRLRRTWASEDLFREAVERWKGRAICPADCPGEADGDGEVDCEACEQACDFFIASWLGRNGMAGTANYNQNFCVRYTANGGIQGTRFAAAVDSIPAWRERLRRVTILRRDGLQLLENIEDQAGTAIYCDPPYLIKGSQYLHDFTPADHERLAQLLQQFRRARVVVSYYDHPDLERLYPDWHRQRVNIAKSLVNQGRRGQEGKVMAPELLLCNQPFTPPDGERTLWT